MSLITTVLEIIKHLPNAEHWHLNKDRSNDHSVRIEGKQGRYMVVRCHHSKAFLYGGWPDDPTSRPSTLRPSCYGLKSPQIGFTITRNPATLASDISRRFLKDYEEVFLKLLEEQKKLKDKIYFNKLKIEALERVFNVNFDRNQDALCPTLYINKKHRIKFYYDGSVDLKIERISFDECFKALSSIITNC